MDKKMLDDISKVVRESLPETVSKELQQVLAEAKKNAGLLEERSRRIVDQAAELAGLRLRVTEQQAELDALRRHEAAVKAREDKVAARELELQVADIKVAAAEYGRNSIYTLVETFFKSHDSVVTENGFVPTYPPGSSFPQSAPFGREVTERQVKP